MISIEIKNPERLLECMKSVSEKISAIRMASASGDLESVRTLIEDTSSLQSEASLILFAAEPTVQ